MKVSSARALAASPRPAYPPGRLDIDQAWKVLELVNEWIRHADNKGAITMGASGAIGGALYNLVISQKRLDTILDVAAGLCAVLVIAAAVFAVLGFMPRMRPRDEPVSLIYFHHIARRYQGPGGGARYAHMLKSLTADDSLLLDDLCMQIWANTQVACQKYGFNMLGLRAVCLAIIALSATAVIAATVG